MYLPFKYFLKAFQADMCKYLPQPPTLGRLNPFPAWLEQFSSVQFNRPVVSNSLQPHGLQHARLTCPSPTPRAYSYSCPSSQWCYPTISSSVIPFSSQLQSFPTSQWVMSRFSSKLVLRIRWPKYWSFSFNISPSNDYSGLISFRMGQLDLLAVKGLSRVFSNTTVQFFGAQLSL